MLKTCISSLRLIRATARVCCNIRCGEDQAEDMSIHSTCGDVEGSGGTNGNGMAQSSTGYASPSSLVTTPRWMFRSTPYSLPQTDEGVVIQALYVVLTPLLSDVEEEWHKFFGNHFNLHDVKDIDATVHEVEACLREVLLEWGYGDTCEGEASLKMGEGVHLPEGPLEYEEGEEKSGKSQHIEAGSEVSCKKLSRCGTSLLSAALHLHSLLALHGCCCIRAPPAAGKTTVWRVSIANMLSLYAIGPTITRTMGV